MLINFSFKNFGCFRDEQNFSMERHYVSRSARSTSDGISTVAAIYGPNASGKSTLFNAMGFFIDFVLDSHSRGDAKSSINRHEFMLDPNSANQPTEFAIEATTSDGLRYLYSFGIIDNVIDYEELIVYLTNRPSLMFSRGHGKTSIEFGANFKGPRKQVWKITRENSLFLSASVASGGEIATKVCASIRQTGQYEASSYMAELTRIKLEARNSPVFLSNLSNLIRCADFGIDQIEIRRSNTNMSEEVNSALNHLLDIVSDNSDASQRKELQYDLSTDLFFHHIGSNDGAWLPSAQESDGTIAALAFYSVALRAMKHGDVVLVDEIERSMHPLLVREFIRLFEDETCNPNHAQLIFTSHDIALISETSDDARAVKRDQIWFTSKDSDGASDLYPLTDFRPRKDENVGRNYLNGVYQALPNPDICTCFASACDYDASEVSEADD